MKRVYLVKGGGYMGDPGMYGIIYVKDFDGDAKVEVSLATGLTDRLQDADEIGFYTSFWPGIKKGDKVFVYLVGVYKVPHRGYPSAIVYKTKEEAEACISPDRPDLNQRVIEATVEDMP